MSFNHYHLVTHTNLHCGSGQSVGIVDQPIIRERATNLPIVPGATLRGVLRAHLSTAHLSTDGKENDVTNVLFGRPAQGGAENFSGALSLTDAHLLVLPVRSLYGIVAYVTCPFILRRYKKELELPIALPATDTAKACFVDGNQNVAAGKVVFEELDIEAVKCEEVQLWAEQLSQTIYANDETAQTDFQQHFVIVPDNVFAYLAETATEIRTRIRMNQETGVADGGALWTEESLPAESLLWGRYSLNERTKDYSEKHAEQFKEQAGSVLLQMGGNAGIGNGLVQFTVQEAKK